MTTSVTTLIVLFVVLVAVVVSVPHHGHKRPMRPDIARKHRDMRRDWDDVTKHPRRKFSDKIRERIRNFSRMRRGWRARGVGSGKKTTTTATPKIVSTIQPPQEALSIRTDIRLFTKAQWQDFYTALSQLNQQFPDPANPVSLYDVFSGYHRKSEAPAAHYGPAFIPWHSLYIYSLESALKQLNPDVSVPLLDSRPDTEIPNYCDSCLFTADLLGNPSGIVTVGPFKNKKVYPPDCSANEFGPLLSRNCTNDAELLFNYEEFDAVLKNNNRYEDFVYPYTEEYEENHGGLHGIIGGHLGILTCAPNDPAFYMLHGFVHAMFDLAMDKHYSVNEQSALQYPSEGDIPPEHLGDSLALPFNITARQALKESMERNTQYNIVPSHCVDHSDCNPTGSDLNAYWCKASSGRCASKIRIGGLCVENSTNYPDQACFRQSFCSDEPKCGSPGRCQCTDHSGNVIDQPPLVEV